ncbi:hypothetical protein MVEN_01300900 [Mycena venus]|uniref:Uncharacterized protein n=1 Tax=Mycena venus TaxID=2733690 RepID=A0A8H6Y080_9AGAR|nr:hypothetical protein MVEN_01300900 [Mycena venus]
MFFPAATAVVDFIWAASIFLQVSAVGTHGAAIWIAPTSNTVVAECYPLSIQFTSPVAARNISFFYYVGKQGYPGQTIILITTWPESTWVNASTVYTASSASVPVAAGTMIALRIMDYDDSPSFLNQIVIQPNTDTSCITDASQFGIPTYNNYPAQPASTTVSPSKPESTGGPILPPVTSSDTTTAPVDPKPSADSTSNPAPTHSSAPSSSSSSSTSSARNATSSAATNPSTVSQSVDFTASSNTPSAVNFPAGVSGSSPKRPSSALIAGTAVAATIGLILTVAAGAWFVRCHNRHRIAEVQNRATYIARPYAVPPPPIREVDAGMLVFGEPERLPPQYDEIAGSPSTGSDRGKAHNVLVLR